MGKVQLKPQTLLIPLPAVMVSCMAEGYEPNIITISWIGIVCSTPPMLSISVTPQRYSHNIIKKSGQFVVNLTSEKNLKETDFCGTKSGRDTNKFSELGLMAVQSNIVEAPMIGECPINLECEVKQSHVLGTHEMFIAEILAVHADEDLIMQDGRIDIDKLQPLTYCTAAREYRGGLTKMMGRYGDTAKK